jgi:hypothetical protein
MVLVLGKESVERPLGTERLSEVLGKLVTAVRESVDRPLVPDRLSKVLGKLVTADTESVDRPLGTDRLSKVLGKLVTADTELGSVLSPVGVSPRDRLRLLREPDTESVGKVGDSVGEPRDSVTELDIEMVGPEVRDAAGKVTDSLSPFDNELGLEQVSGSRRLCVRGLLHLLVMWTLTGLRKVGIMTRRSR